MMVSRHWQRGESIILRYWPATPRLIQIAQAIHGSFDQLLDIMVRPDRSYYWKDEEQLALMVSKGFYTIAEAEEIRQAGEEVVPLIEAGKPPFDDSWTNWWPAPDLVLGPIPDGWQF
jgi:hypothetical protein